MSFALMYVTRFDWLADLDHRDKFILNRARPALLFVPQNAKHLVSLSP